MSTAVEEVEEFLRLAELFSYPRRLPRTEPGAEPCAQAVAGLTELQNDYVRLFINAPPETACPPYASCYLEGRLMGAAAVRLAGLYRDYGFEAVDLADHIAVELEFLALLTYLGAHAASDGGDDRRAAEDADFLRNHLRQWGAAFFDRVEHHDTGFYARAARRARRVLGLQAGIGS